MTRHDIRRAHFGRSYRGDRWAPFRDYTRRGLLDPYDRQGRRITMRRYIALVEHRGLRYKRVAHTTLPNHQVRVSTVWLGLDHNFYPWDSGPPIIFETMVFPLDEFTDLAMWRYGTEREARKGHNRAVHLVRTGEVDVFPWDDADSQGS